MGGFTLGETDSVATVGVHRGNPEKSLSLLYQRGPQCG